MYFDKFKIEKLLKNLVANFNGMLWVILILEIIEKINPNMMQQKTNSSKFKTSFEDMKDLSSTNKKLKLKEQKFYHNEEFTNLFGWRRILVCLLDAQKGILYFYPSEFIFSISSFKTLSASSWAIWHPPAAS